MRVKYILKEKGKFAVKDEKFLDPLAEFDTKEEAISYVKKQLDEAEEKFEVQVQQENGEFMLVDVTAIETPETETPEEVKSESETPEEVKSESESETPETPEEVKSESESETPETPEEVKSEPETPEVVVDETPPVIPEPVVEEKAPEAQVVTETATETATATAVQPVAEKEETPATTDETTPETMNVDASETAADSSTQAKPKFNIKDIWTNPEYRKWLYLGIAVLIEVAIIIAIIVLIAQ